jgi:hypothetical protein
MASSTVQERRAAARARNEERRAQPEVAAKLEARLGLSEWPFTCRCPACDYIGWPNTTDLRDGGVAYPCPRAVCRRPMERIRITAWEPAEFKTGGEA